MSEDLKLGKNPGVDYSPKSKGDRDFVAKHKVQKTKMKTADKEIPHKIDVDHVLSSPKEKAHGYTLEKAKKVYEEKMLNEVGRLAAKTGNQKALAHHILKKAVDDVHDLWDGDEPSSEVRNRYKIRAKHSGTYDDTLSMVSRHHRVDKDKLQKAHSDSVQGKEVKEQLEESTRKEINDRLDSLVFARKAEKDGNKKEHYFHMAQYHDKYSRASKLSKADAAHHKSQAEKYKNAFDAFKG